MGQLVLAILYLLSCVSEALVKPLRYRDALVAGLVPFVQSISIDQCEAFAIFAGEAVIFRGQKSTILTGSIGISPGISLDGDYNLISNELENNSTNAAVCAIGFDDALSAASNASCSRNSSLLQLSALRLLPGVYCSPFDLTNFSGKAFIFDGCNKSNSQWIIQSSAALIVSSLTTFDLINGATSNNVFWRVGSSMTIGCYSNLVGNILAQNSISFGIGSVLVGRALAKDTVFFAGGSSLAIPISLSSFVPSSAPTTNRTSFPSAVPSPAPTYAAESPTPAPSTSTVLSIEVTQVISGIPIQDAVTKAFATTFQIGISQIIPLSVNDIEINDIGGHVTNQGGIFIANDSSVDVIYTVQVMNGNTSMITSILTNSNFSAAITSSLQLSGYESAAAASVQLRNLSPTSSPTKGHHKNASGGYAYRGIIIGGSVGVLGACLISIYFIYATGACKKSLPPPDRVIYYADNVLSSYEINKLTYPL
jgi:Ice-binding-like